MRQQSTARGHEEILARIEVYADAVMRLLAEPVGMMQLSGRPPLPKPGSDATA